MKAVFDPQEPTKNLTITSGLLGVDEEGNYSMLGSIKPAKSSVLLLHEKTFKDFDEAPPIKETFVVSVTQ